MPNIRIIEKDLTSVYQSNPTETIVYIPGFMGTGATTATAEVPTLCRTVAEFEKYFGTGPATGEGEAFANPQISTGSYSFQFPDNLDGKNVIKGTVDIAYLYAHQLLVRGVPVLYEAIKSETVGTIIASDIATLYTKFVSKDFWGRLTSLDYNVKYITSGGYPIFEFGTSKDKFVVCDLMLEAAEKCGDCVALIDYEYIDKRTLDSTNADSVYSVLQGLGSAGEKLTYGAMFAPYANYTISATSASSDYTKLTAPASFGYLLALANSINNKNADWLAVAGSQRGVIPELDSLIESMNSSIANDYNKVDGKISINSITRIRNLGTIIWSNRTLQKNSGTDIDITSKTGEFPILPALSLLNLRVMTNDIKKILKDTALYYTFENNDDILWLNFRAKVDSYLDTIVSNGGLRTYELNRVGYTGRNTLKVQLKLYPIQPVENWDIEIELRNATEVE